MKNARKTYPILISKQDTFSEFNGLFMSGLDKALLMLYICILTINELKLRPMRMSYLILHLLCCYSII